MTEFIRRFLLHVLPDGFVKIRYFGYLSHRHKKRYLPLIHRLIDPEEKPPVRIKETVAQANAAPGANKGGCAKDLQYQALIHGTRLN